MSFIGATQAMTIPLVALYSAQLGADAGLVGAVVTAGFILPVFLAVPVGALVDRLGARAMIAAGAAGLAVAPLAPLLAPSIPSVFALQLLAGVAHLTAVVAAQALVASLGAGAHRVRNFGWYTTMVSLGQFVGPLLIGAAIDFGGYRSSLLLLAIAPTLGLAACAFLRPREASAGLAPPHRPGEILGLGRSGPVQLALLASGVTLFALGIHQSFFPVYLDKLAYPASTIGVLVSLRALVAMVVRPLLPLLAARSWSRTALLSAMLLGLGLSVAALSLPPVVAVLAIASVGLGIASGVTQPLTMVVLSDGVVPTLRGVGLGMRLTVNYLAMGASGVLVGALIGLIGYRPGFAACGLLIASASAIVARMDSRGLVPDSAD